MPTTQHSLAAKAPARPAAARTQATPRREMPRAAVARARFGNAGTAALLADRAVVRPKLELGAASDPLEREADATADKVVRMKAGGDCAACARDAPCDGGGAKVRRASDADGGGAMPLAPAAEASIRRATSGGEPLPGKVRAAMEPAFGADFSGVRVHRDAAAADSARGIGARAYTVGNHVAFGQGQWAPGSDRGDHLIAHELTHTLQDGGATARTVRGDFLDDLGDAAGAVADAASETASEVAGAAAGAANDAYAAVAEVVGQGIDGAAEVAGAAAEAVTDAAAAVAGAVSGTVEAVDEAPELARQKLLGQVAGAQGRLGGVSPEALISDGPQVGALNAQLGTFSAVAGTAAFAPAIPWGPAVPTIGRILAAIIAALAGLAAWKILLIVAVVAAIILLILWFLDTSKTKPITVPITPPVTVPVPVTPPKKDPKKGPKTDDPPPPLPQPDDCLMRFGLVPGINARRHEQRGAIKGEVTVDRGLFRLDAGIAPPKGTATDGASRAWSRQIGCPPDDAGHVIARRFGGDAQFGSSQGNIYPQDLTFNRGQMSQTDKVIAERHRAGHDVCALIQLSYTPEDSLRPTHAVYAFMTRPPGQARFGPMIPTVQRNESSDPACTA
jgi:hypothetical protein